MKAREDAQKEYDNTLKSYQDQIGYVGRLQKLLQQGVDTEVARVAAEKEYAKNIVTTGLAQEVVTARQVQARLDYQFGLEDELDIISRITELTAKGATYEQARELAQAGFKADTEGVETLINKITNELLTQQQVSYAQNKTQSSLNKYLAEGFSIEEASTQLAFDRFALMSGGLNKQGQLLRDQIMQQLKQKIVLEQEEQLYKDINSIEQKRIVLQKIMNSSVDAHAVALTKARIENNKASEDLINSKIS